MTGLVRGGVKVLFLAPPRLLLEVIERAEGLLSQRTRCITMSEPRGERHWLLLDNEMHADFGELGAKMSFFQGPADLRSLANDTGRLSTEPPVLPRRGRGGDGDIPR